jgi:hypothetical protein
MKVGLWGQLLVTGEMGLGSEANRKLKTERKGAHPVSQTEKTSWRVAGWKKVGAKLGPKPEPIGPVFES